MLKRLIILLMLTSLITLIVMSLPDIKRYLQIRRMLLRTCGTPEAG
jgi:hypothetical protein